MQLLSVPTYWDSVLRKRCMVYSHDEMVAAYLGTWHETRSNYFKLQAVLSCFIRIGRLLQALTYLIVPGHPSLSFPSISTRSSAGRIFQRAKSEMARIFFVLAVTVSSLSSPRCAQANEWSGHMRLFELLGCFVVMIGLKQFYITIFFGHILSPTSTTDLWSRTSPATCRHDHNGGQAMARTPSWGWMNLPWPGHRWPWPNLGDRGSGAKKLKLLPVEDFTARHGSIFACTCCLFLLYPVWICLASNDQRCVWSRIARERKTIRPAHTMSITWTLRMPLFAHCFPTKMPLVAP